LSGDSTLALPDRSSWIKSDTTKFLIDFQDANDVNIYPRLQATCQEKKGEDIDEYQMYMHVFSWVRKM